MDKPYTKLKPGDIVRFLNDVGGGKVTEIVDSKLVKVLIEEGFEIPVMADDLVKIEADNPGAIETKTPKESPAPRIIDEPEDLQPEPDIPAEEDDGDTENVLQVFLAFRPLSDNYKECDLALYLINDSRYEALYNIIIINDDEHTCLESGKTEPETKVYLAKFKRQELNSLTGIQFQAIFCKNGVYEPLEPVNKKIRIKASRFFKSNSYKPNDYFDENALLLSAVEEDLAKETEELTAEDIKKILDEKHLVEKETRKKSRKYKPRKEVPLKEVDLHIHELIEDYKGLTNSEMLNIQVNKFRQELESAIAHNIKKIVFIHGVGVGTLKFEIRRILDKEYPNLRYQDASFQEYGYGATMVMIH